MASNDREVWVNMVSTNNSAPELNYLTYAIYSFEKYEWYDQIEKAKGKPPTAVEINDWISQITDTRMRAWRESAARTFDSAAREYMKDILLQERQKAADDRVINAIQSALNEFKKAASFRNQILIGFVISLLSPIFLGIVILAIQSADLWPTPTGVAHMFQTRHPEPPATGAVHNP